MKKEIRTCLAASIGCLLAFVVVVAILIYGGVYILVRAGLIK